MSNTFHTTRFKLTLTEETFCIFTLILSLSTILHKAQLSREATVILNFLQNHITVDTEPNNRYYAEAMWLIPKRAPPTSAGKIIFSTLIWIDLNPEIQLICGSRLQHSPCTDSNYSPTVSILENQTGMACLRL